MWAPISPIYKDIRLDYCPPHSGSAGKGSACNAGDLSSVPGLGRSPGEGKGYPLQCSGLENPGLYSPWGCKESDTTEQLSLSLYSDLILLLLFFFYLFISLIHFLWCCVCFCRKELESAIIMHTPLPPKPPSSSTIPSLQVITEHLSMFAKCWVLFCVRLFSDPMDCSPPGSSVHGIFQAGILEQVAISSSRGSS